MCKGLIIIYLSFFMLLNSVIAEQNCNDVKLEGYYQQINLLDSRKVNERLFRQSQLEPFIMKKYTDRLFKMYPVVFKNGELVEISHYPEDIKAIIELRDEDHFKEHCKFVYRPTGRDNEEEFPTTIIMYSKSGDLIINFDNSNEPQTLWKKIYP